MDHTLKELLLRLYIKDAISTRDFLDDMQRLGRVKSCLRNYDPELTTGLLLNQMITLLNTFTVSGMMLALELKMEMCDWPRLYSMLEEMGFDVPQGPRDLEFSAQLRYSLKRFKHHEEIFESVRQRG
ncbi:MAG: DUF7207 family protein [Aeromonas popoffii]|uniref:DUF7207 family protein n=1 Tax=Aeromonas popoffii TaxID=70856 RepID=UPI003F3A7A3D